MSSPSSSPTPEPQDEDSQLFEIMTSATHYIAQARKKGRGGKLGPVTYKTETKNKQVEFKLDPDDSKNYSSFLNTIYRLHDSKAKGTITEKSPYSFKMAIPPKNTKTNAVDIDSREEYEDHVNKLLAAVKDGGGSGKSTKPVAVWFDMKHAKGFLKDTGNNDDDNDNSARKDGSNEDHAHSTDDEGSVDGDGLTKLDRALAEITLDLQKNYAVAGEENCYAYLDPETGILVYLTPQMTKEWYDKICTLDAPPRTTTFDFVNRQRSIRRHRSVSESSMTEKGPLEHFVDILGHLKDISGNCSVAVDVPDTTSSLPEAKNTPTTLRRFLSYAKTQHNVVVPARAEEAMTQLGFGPDVLHLVTSSELEQLGFTKGDTIRIKTHAEKWWKGPDARQPFRRSQSPHARSPAVNPSLPNPGPFTPLRVPRPQTPTNDSREADIRFEKRFRDGSGASTVWGYGFMDAGSPKPDIDYDWFWYSNDLKRYLPMPCGSAPELEGQICPLDMD
ncbi:hypothetical protein AAF712_015605 [Marasmius tenuissimus]|uniref:SAM domain-containing protein n=1 Tax=Marasmius tenuissimus TaxID=585030 RepID=A0ABR2Z8R8_9AGAR